MASHPWIAIACCGVLLAALIALAAIVSGRGSRRPAGCRAALVPAYTSPRGLAELARGGLHPQLVVVNPRSGPGAAKSGAYVRAVRAAQAAGMRVLGYVATAHGGRARAAVEREVARYRSWYAVDGIFFDEAAASAAALPSYRALARSARAADLAVVLNPGVVPARGYFEAADEVVTYEGPVSGYPTALRAMPGWLRGETAEHAVHLLYGASRAQALAAARRGAAGLLYATSGVLPNPWRTPPPYLHDEEGALSPCR